MYGLPRGASGRNGVPIMGIAVHCLNDSYAGYLQKTCSASPSLLQCEHTSMHYVVDGVENQVSTLVKDEDLAWAFQSYPSNASLPNPLDPYPGWPLLSGLFPAVSADFYTLNIGITVPTPTQVDILDGGDDCCIGPYGMTWESYHTLVRLIAYLADKYNIPIEQPYIDLHDNIVETVYGCEECRCSRLVCLICDISAYCESCSSVGDPSFPLHTEIDMIYGEFRGCKVKVTLERFMEILANAQL